jgi:hypothetical protein
MPQRLTQPPRFVLLAITVRVASVPPLLVLLAHITPSREKVSSQSAQHALQATIVQQLALLLLPQHSPAQLGDTVQPAQARLAVQHAQLAHIAGLGPQLLSLAPVVRTRLTLVERSSSLTVSSAQLTSIALCVVGKLPRTVASLRQMHMRVEPVTAASAVLGISGQYQPPIQQQFRRELRTAPLVTTVSRRSSASSFAQLGSISQTRDNLPVFVAQQVHSVSPLV